MFGCGRPADRQCRDAAQLIIIMGAKKSFVLRLDPAMYEAVERWAADEFRSTNGQMEWIISEALRKAGRARKREEESRKDREKDRQGE